MISPRHSRRILIAPDKFKGTLSADSVACAIAAGWRQCRPLDKLDLLPVSDGGDGFGAIVGGRVFARRVCLRTKDAAHRPRSVIWWWASESRTAIIESATVVGMCLFGAKRVHPFELDTFGLAALLRDAARRNARECIIGLGGSATNDAGFGLARGMGWKFLNQDDKPLQYWWQLQSLAKIIPPKIIWRIPITAASDVNNRLLGSRGCCRVYGPQKGLTSEDVKHAEKCLTRLAIIYHKQFNRDPARILGSGAAGGLGFGLVAFTSAKIVSGFDILAKFTDLEAHVRDADLVITGEGRLDAQSHMGKAVGQLAHRCRKWGIPCVGFAGTIQKTPRHKKMFSLTAALTDIVSHKNALARPEIGLKKLARRTAQLWNNDLSHGPAKT
jgi:glycerate 2-kinase